MAQRPAPPRHREALRCARDARTRNRCARRPCLALSPCPEDALDGSGGRRVVAGARCVTAPAHGRRIPSATTTWTTGRTERREFDRTWDRARCRPADEQAGVRKQAALASQVVTWRQRVRGGSGARGLEGRRRPNGLGARSLYRLRARHRAPGGRAARRPRGGGHGRRARERAPWCCHRGRRRCRPTSGHTDLRRGSAPAPKEIPLSASLRASLVTFIDMPGGSRPPRS
jgi:hypothetical protein